MKLFHIPNGMEDCVSFAVLSNHLSRRFKNRKRQPGWNLSTRFFLQKSVIVNVPGTCARRIPNRKRNPMQEIQIDGKTVKKSGVCCSIAFMVSVLAAFLREGLGKTELRFHRNLTHRLNKMDMMITSG